ncbi:unnamed protein product [Heligmosomoides polygyrus]|uniref:Uncharacterized protein n=1 Tax=Heligmosomoides polygyrus TaxID=6339 RepID=A0A183G5M4_HELPZ|nr:unnamed protein product [Heligmosomoides polygyrus]
MSLEGTPRNSNRHHMAQQSTNDPKNAREGFKRKQPEKDPEELKRENEKRLRQCEEQHEISEREYRARTTLWRQTDEGQ